MTGYDLPALYNRVLEEDDPVTERVGMIVLDHNGRKLYVIVDASLARAGFTLGD